MTRLLLFIAIATIGLSVTGLLEPQRFREGQVIHLASGETWTVIAEDRNYPGLWTVNTARFPNGCHVLFSVDEDELVAAMDGEHPLAMIDASRSRLPA